MRKFIFKLKEYIYKHFIIHFLYQDEAFKNIIFQSMEDKNNAKGLDNYNLLFIAPPTMSMATRNEIKFRINYFLNDIKVLIISNLAFLPDIVTIPAICTGEFDDTTSKILFKKGLFKVGYMSISHDGWVWHQLINAIYPFDRLAVIRESRERLVSFYAKQKALNKDKVFVLGTGPSLAKYKSYDYSNSLKIVCNTIVRDKETWDFLRPDIIVASDAIYHFDFNELAEKFREDLKERLRENPDCLFGYTDLFHSFISREFKEFADRLVPIPCDTTVPEYINTDILNKFEVGPFSNILGLLMLPLGCSFSKNIYLLGFDGRKPNDKLFWNYSKKHSYKELIQKVKDAHPCFFEKSVPESNPGIYVQNAFSNFDNTLSALEERGWKFNVLNDSTTPGLKNRRVRV